MKFTVWKVQKIFFLNLAYAYAYGVFTAIPFQEWDLNITVTLLLGINNMLSKQCSNNNKKTFFKQSTKLSTRVYNYNMIEMEN